VRVLCIGNRFPPSAAEGGYEVIWAGAVRALRDAGHELGVLTTTVDPPAPGDEDVRRELRWYWRDHAFPPLSLRATVALERHNEAVLRRTLAGFAPDVVCFWSMGGMSLSLLEQVRRAGLPATAVVCDDWIAYAPRVDGWSARPRGVRAVVALASGLPARVDLDRAAHWMFISDYTLETARAHGWRLPGAVVEPAGIDARRFAPQAGTEWRWRLLYPGRLDSRKGVGTAIEALARLPKQATLMIKGDGEPAYVAELRELAQRLAVADRVTFAPYARADVVTAYSAADAIVFPVRWREPWGLVPLEAMAVGRPVLASRAGGGAAEYLADGINCLQFEPGDADGLATALERLAADPRLREKLRAGGFETAARYTDERFHAALERELLAVARNR
jgi:glycogen synthase